jgi:hypothetical protein
MKKISVSPSKPKENQVFWQQHYESLKLSKLSRLDYCRQHGLNYDRFGYWISKWNRSPSEKLISVKLKSTIEPATEKVIICALDLKNGNSLKVYDVKVLLIILEKYC